jgi:phospholipase C
MEHIEHVVVLMLENRSFDSVLGWLYEDPNDPPGLIIGPDGPYRGLQGLDLGKFTNTALSNPALTAEPTRGAQGFTSPAVDPGEEFEHVNQQFWGTYTDTPDDTKPPTMSGVLSDFVSVLQGFGYTDDQVRAIAPMALECYTPAQLPVLNQLARHYAVCDDWFASVPSQTNTNRAFLLCGTSHGQVNNGWLETDPRAKPIEDAFMKIGDDRFTDLTIFNELADAGKDWAVFWQTGYLPQKLGVLMQYVQGLSAAMKIIGVFGGAFGAIAEGALEMIEAIEKMGPDQFAYLEELSRGDLASSYTWRLFPQIQQIPGAANHFQRLDDFHRRARSGALPAFSYIEPLWTISHATTGNSIGKRLISTLGNDYHPPSSLIIGEEFVKDVYTSLISNTDAWNKTLLLITFDEFVGTWDHVTGPWLEKGAVAPPTGPGGYAPKGAEADFEFTRLGGRVATLVVSPYVQKGTIFRAMPEGRQKPGEHPTARMPFDHTSLIATTMKWIGRDADTADKFHARAASVPTFDVALALTTPRTDQADPKALTFLDVPQADGDPLRYGDWFLLKNANGNYMTTATADMKDVGGGAIFPTPTIDLLADIGLSAYFPTLGSGDTVPVTFVTHSVPRTPGPPSFVSYGDQVRILSREAQLGSRNMLGIWPATDGGSNDCFYYDEYVTGDDALAQTWTVEKADTSSGPGVRYGDMIYLTTHSTAWAGMKLMHNATLFQSHWVTVNDGGDEWTIVPMQIS